MNSKSDNYDLSDLGLDPKDLPEMTLDAVLFLDADGVVRYWNRGATVMFGYEPSEVLGKNIRFIIPRDLLKSGELERLKVICEQETALFNYTTRRVRKDGETIWVNLSRTSSTNSEGRELGAVAILRDVTAQRAAEQELEHSKRLALVGELAAKIAHEVKNPLAGIHAALQVLEGQLEPKDPRREIFDSIGDEVIRLNELTMDLLRFARPTAAKFVRADLGQFLVDLVGDLERISMVGPKDVDLTGLELGLNLPFDPALTGQVFKNLILNGLQANKGKGVIRISSRNHEGTVAIDVADSGPGIRKEDLGSIFEPFFTTKSRGTGLGLSIAKNNLEAQKATIRIRSHRGRGAIFRIEFLTQ